APLTLLIRGDGRAERRSVEMGPKQVGEIKLGIGELPEQEVGETLLASGAYEKIRLRSVSHRQVRLERFGDESSYRFRMRGHESFHRLGNVPSAAVIRRHG